MAAGPNVTATIVAKDEASQVISKIVANAREAGGEISRTASLASSEASAQARATQEAVMAQRAALAQQREQVAALKSEALVAFGAIADHGVKAMMQIGGEMERTQRRFASFTNATKEQLAAIRQQADTTGAGLKGGPEGFFEGARAAAMSGVKPEQAALAARYGAVFADETGEDNAAATEKLIQHTSMLGHLRDEASKPISFAEANTEQVDSALRETLNLLIAINKVAPGNIGQVYEGFKFAGPVSLGLGRSDTEAAALYTVLAEHGIVGAEAGNTIKSAMSRGLAPTAKARIAIAAHGMNYGDYVHLDADAMDADNIEKGVSLRLGTLNAATKTGIHKAVDDFKRDRNVDNFQRELTDTLLQSGAKTVNDRIKASNLARDVGQSFASTFDLPKALKDAHDHGGGVGLLDAWFGQQIGGRLAAVSGQEVLDKENLLRTEAAKDNVGEAQRERAASYDGLKGAFYGQLQGMYDRLFEAGIKQPAMVGYGAGADLFSGIANAPEHVRAWIAEMTAATSVIGGSAAATMLARLGGAMTGLGLPTEGAIGNMLSLGEAIGSFAALRFAGGGLAGYQVWEAIKPGLEGLADVIKGRYFTPSSVEGVQDLHQEHDELVAEIARRRAASGNYSNEHDPELKRLEGELAAAQARMGNTGKTPIDADPEVRRLQGEVDRLRGAPAKDPEVARLEAKLADLQRPTPKEAVLKAAIERREHLDASDPGLPRLRQDLDRLQAQRQRDRVDLNGDQAGLQAQLDRARQTGAAATRQALADKEHELADLRAKLTQGPAAAGREIDSLQHQVEARRAENLRNRADFVDPSIQPLEDRVAQLEGRIASYNRVNHPNPFLTAEEPELHGGPQMPVPAPTPTINPFLVAGTSAPTFRLDNDLAGIARASGGLNGTDIAGALRGVLMGMPAAKVDPVTVHGDVKGTVENVTTIGVKVEPSPMLKAVLDRAEQVLRSDTNLLGRLNGEDMPSNYGVRAPIPGGIGHHI